MKKTILVLIAFLAIMSVIGYITKDEELVRGLVFGLLPGVLLALITLIPAVRKRAQSNLAGRVVTLLVVMILSAVLAFPVLTWLDVKFYYSSSWELGTFEIKYEENSGAIERETWIRAMVPPFLRGRCYTSKKDVCEFVDQFPNIRGLMTRRRYSEVVKFALGLSLPGVALAWSFFTPRKHSQEVVVKASELVSISILVLSVLVIFVEYKWYLGEDMLSIIGLLVAGVLPGILLALITLVPAVHRRVRSDLAKRVVAILVVMMLSAALVFSFIRWWEVQSCYLDLIFPSEFPDPDYDSLSGIEFYTFILRYEQYRGAIDRETLIRAMVPPILRWQCYTSKEYVCTHVDQFPKSRKLLSWNRYLLVVAIALGFSLPGGALAWRLTRRKHLQEAMTEG